MACRDDLRRSSRCSALTAAARTLLFYAASTAAATCAAAPAHDDIQLVDRFVPHRSTAPANAGEAVGLYLREKFAGAEPGRKGNAGRVVLMIHGGIVSSLPDFDLPYGDYSWMDHLARAGFDVFAMDHTGYGRSPRPAMDDPCNLGPQDRARVQPDLLQEPCAPSYTGPVTTRESDWDEIATVVDFIRGLRGVTRIHLIGWSLGGPRAGGFAARHPDKVARLFLYSPAYSPTGPGNAAPPRYPMRLRGLEMLTRGRWQQRVTCEGQVDPDIRTVIWRTILDQDPLGARWGAPVGLMRLRSGHPRVDGAIAWDRAGAARVRAQTLIVSGAQEHLRPKRALYEDLTGAAARMFVTMACATHYALWEVPQHGFLHRASVAWLRDGALDGFGSGRFEVDTRGRLTAAGEP